jgi:dienelactone hydrolase
MKTLLCACLAASFILLAPEIGQTAPKSRTDVVLNSFNVKSSNPAMHAEWQKNPIETPAVLTLPSSVDGIAHYPAIVYLPGSGGIHKSDKRWQKQFLNEGYAVLQLDVYSNRGMSLKRGLGKKQTGMTNISYLSDIYAGVRYLKNHPRIHPDRIGLFGRSWGGGMQIYTMMGWYQNMVGEGLDVAARIALYPACTLTTETPIPTAGKSLLLLGGKDDWNAPGQCIDFASRYRSAGGELTVEIFPDAVHSWDSGRKVKTKRGVNVWGRNCHNLWDPTTMKVWQSDSEEKFDLPDGWSKVWDCVARKVSVKTGGTSEQLRKTEELVFSFLSENL